MTENNILKESCDNVASGTTACDPDQQYFKVRVILNLWIVTDFDQGAWTKHLQYYLDYANDASRTAKYSSFLGSQRSAILRYGINSKNDVSSTWYAANEGGGVFHAQTDASGLAALNSAAKVRHGRPGSCALCLHFCTVWSMLVDWTAWMCLHRILRTMMYTSQQSLPHRKDESKPTPNMTKCDQSRR